MNESTIKQDEDDRGAHLLENDRVPNLARGMKSIKVEHDFYISKLLQKHGVNIEDSICMAGDNNLMAKFLDLHYEAGEQGLDDIDQDQDNYNKVDNMTEIVPYDI